MFGGDLYRPNGILLRFNSSGVYFPFTGEGHVDNGLHPVSKPFTIAHELGHGYGFGSEDVCNFLGFLACVRSDNPAIRYAGYLTVLALRLWFFDGVYDGGRLSNRASNDFKRDA